MGNPSEEEPRFSLTKNGGIRNPTNTAVSFNSLCSTRLEMFPAGAHQEEDSRITRLLKQENARPSRDRSNHR